MAELLPQTSASESLTLVPFSLCLCSLLISRHVALGFRYSKWLPSTLRRWSPMGPGPIFSSDPPHLSHNPSFLETHLPVSPSTELADSFPRSFVHVLAVGRALLLQGTSCLHSVTLLFSLLMPLTTILPHFIVFTVLFCPSDMLTFSPVCLSYGSRLSNFRGWQDGP